MAQEAPRDAREHTNQILENAKKRAAESAAAGETPKDTSVNKPVAEETSPPPAEPIPPKKEEAPAEETVHNETPDDVAETTDNSEFVPIDLDGDNDTPSTTSEEALLPDFAIELSNALDFKANSPLEFATKVKDLKLQNDELKSQLESKETKPISPALQKAIEIEQAGGDPLDYLGVAAIDYSTLNAADMYNSYLMNTTGLTAEAVRDWIETMPEAELTFRANEYKNALVNSQAQSKARIEQETVAKRAENLKRLEASLSTFDNVLGFKVKDSDKKEIRDQVVDGTITKNLLYDGNGNIDFTAVQELAFLKKNREKIAEFIKTSTRNQTKREIVDSIANKSNDRNPKVETVVTASKDDGDIRAKAQRIKDSLKGGGLKNAF